MSHTISTTLVLTGPRTGKTVRLNKYTFTDGRLSLKGPMEDVQGLITYFGKAYQAFPEGSDELKAAQAHWEQYKAEQEASHGAGEVHPDQSGAAAPAVHGDGGPDGAEPPAAPAGDGEGDDDPAAGSQGSVPGGDGHTDPGLPPQEHNEEQPVDGTPGPVNPNPKLLKAVESLDPENDAHWTGQGLPKVAVVSDAYGEDSVTRKDVESVAPGYDRETAKKKAEADELAALA